MELEEQPFQDGLDPALYGNAFMQSQLRGRSESGGVPEGTDGSGGFEGAADGAEAGKRSARRDAAKLLEAFSGPGTSEGVVHRILAQPAEHVQEVRRIYDSQYNNHEGKGLVADLRHEFRDLDGDEGWDFVLGQLKRAGISAPNEPAEYHRRDPSREGPGSAYIKADPDLSVAVPGTVIRYSFVRDYDQLIETGSSTEVRWYVLNDPETSALKGKPARSELGEGFKTTARASFVGNHKILARVVDRSRSGKGSAPIWYEFPQTVVPAGQVVEEALSEMSVPLDPKKEIEVTRAFLRVMETAAGQPGSNALDPSTRAAYRTHLTALERRLSSTEGQERIPFKAAHIEAETAQVTPLKVFLARTGSSKGEQTWTLVDVTNPTHRCLTGEYSGTGKDAESAIGAALVAWDTDNRYPEGRIQLEVGAEAAGRTLNHDFQTDGASFWDSIAQFFDAVGLVAGVGALVLGTLSAIAPVPGSRGLSALVWASILASSASAAINIGQRQAEGFSSPREDTLDMLTIVGNILGGAWMKGARILVGGRGGSKIATGLLIGQVATDGAQGVILSSQFVEQYDQVMAIRSPEKRTAAMLELLRSALLAGGMVVVSLRGVRADLATLGAGAKNVDLRSLADPGETLDLGNPASRGGRAADSDGAAHGQGAGRTSRHPNLDRSAVDDLVNGLKGDRAMLKERFNFDVNQVKPDQLIEELAADPRVLGLDDWLSGAATKFAGNGAPEQRYHHINELREVRDRLNALPPGEHLDIRESRIPGTTQTADIANGSGRVEIKTVEAPLEEGKTILKQLKAGASKFQGTGGHGGPYELVIYASYSERALQGVPMGSTVLTTGADGMQTRTSAADGAVLGKPRHFFDPVVHELNKVTGNDAGYQAISKITIRMNNGHDVVLIKEGAKWVRAP